MADFCALEELETLIAPTDGSEPPRPLVRPGMAQRHRLEVNNLRKALESKDARAEAAEHLRALIGKIALTPEPGRDDLRIDLHGDLAGILSIASQKRVRPGKTSLLDASGPNRMALVAGACCQRYLALVTAFDILSCQPGSQTVRTPSFVP